MLIVVSIGGSVIFKNGYPDIDKIKTFSEIILNKKDAAIVVGGGKTAREYISSLRKYVDEVFLDYVGIMATRLNAMLFIPFLKDMAPSTVSPDFLHARREYLNGKIPVLGGTHPGHSTDAVSAMFAEFMKAELLINVTDVDGIFDKDPKKYSDAKFIRKMSFDELLEISKGFDIVAGSNWILDPLCAKIIARSQMKTMIINGKCAKNLKKAIKGERVGTTIGL